MTDREVVNLLRKNMESTDSNDEKEMYDRAITCVRVVSAIEKIKRQEQDDGK